MPRQSSDPDLKREFSKRIKELLGKHSAREIASALGVKPQMIYIYRDARSSPSSEVIRRAMESWPDFSISYRGKSLSLKDFSRPGRPSLIKAKPLQYELWDAIKKLDAESIEIEILKKEVTSVQLGVKISFRNR